MKRSSVTFRIQPMSAPRRNKKCPTNCTIYFVQQKDVTKHWGYVILEGNLGYVLSWWSLNPFEQSITPLKKVSFFNKVSREKLNIMIKTILDNSDSIPLISSQDQGKIYNHFYYFIFLRWSFFGIFDEPFFCCLLIINVRKLWFDHQWRLRKYGL